MKDWLWLHFFAPSQLGRLVIPLIKSNGKMRNEGKGQEEMKRRDPRGQKKSKIRK